MFREAVAASACRFGEGYCLEDDLRVLTLHRDHIETPSHLKIGNGYDFSMQNLHLLRTHGMI